MIQELVSLNESPNDPSLTDLARYKAAGAALARTSGIAKSRGRADGRTPNRRRRLQNLIATAAGAKREHAADLLDNFRLIFGAEREVREFSLLLRRLPVAIDSSGKATQRLCLVAHAYLEEARYCFSEQELASFLAGYQEVSVLEMREIQRLKAALQLELIDRLSASAPVEWPRLMTSLRKMSETTWKDLLESVSDTHHVLRRDPAGAYPRMDSDSRERYRKAIARLAKHSPNTEHQVAETVIRLCEGAATRSDGSRAAVRRTHVGYYLVDQGQSLL